jgi:hypothetical protein
MEVSETGFSMFMGYGIGRKLSCKKERKQFS